MKHGMYYSREYRIWGDMISRCNNSNVRCYKNYGGRGIIVCERWREFINFIADMGPRPGPDYSLDRMDNDGPYEPGNCKWSTREEQQSNKRRARLLTVDGVTMTMTQWARHVGVAQQTIFSRLARGMSAAEAVRKGIIR